MGHLLVKLADAQIDIETAVSATAHPA